MKEEQSAIKLVKGMPPLKARRPTRIAMLKIAENVTFVRKLEKA